MGAASERRRFLDRLVLAIDTSIPAASRRWNARLRSRNRLLEVRNYDDHWSTRSSARRRNSGSRSPRRAARPWRASPRCCARARRVRFSIGEDRARRLDGSSAQRTRDRGRGPLPRDPARQPPARCRRRTHASRAASYRSSGTTRRRAPAAASTGEQKALLIGLVLAHASAGRGDDRHRAAAAARRDRRPSRSRPARRALRRACKLGAQVWMTGADPGAFAESARRATFSTSRSLGRDPAGEADASGYRWPGLQAPGPPSKRSITALIQSPEPFSVQMDLIARGNVACASPARVKQPSSLQRASQAEMNSGAGGTSLSRITASYPLDCDRRHSIGRGIRRRCSMNT